MHLNIHNIRYRFLKVFFFLACFSSSISTQAQQKVIQLYQGSAPGSENWDWDEKNFMAGPPMNANIIYNVSKPTLTVYSPLTSNGMSVLVCPGGGMRVINIEREGVNIATELTKRGYTVFVLKYRVIRSLSDDPWQEALRGLKDTSQSKRDAGAMISKMASQDARTAIRYIRDHSPELGLDSNMVAAIGFSGGGSLVAHLSLHEQKELRPNFSAFIYTVFRAREVPSDLPPAFIAAASDDVLASPVNSLNIYNAWTASKNQAEIHIFEKGGHGLKQYPGNTWMSRYIDWLQLRLPKK